MRASAYFADVAAVFHIGENAFGSGRLIAPGIVLTAGHVVDRPSRLQAACVGWQVRLLRDRGADRLWHTPPYAAEVVWRHNGDLDLALLRIRILNATPAPSLDLAFSSYDRTDPLDQSDAAGFPEARWIDGQLREYSVRGMLRVAGEHDPFAWTVEPADSPLTRAGWKGMSGAVVTRTDEIGRLHLFGVVQEVPANFSGGQLNVARLGAAFEDRQFTSSLAACLSISPQLLPWTRSNASRWLAQIPTTHFPERYELTAYCPRPFLQSALEHFLNDPERDCGIWRLQGDGGIGKTAFLAHVAASSNCIRYFAEPGIADPLAPARSLIAQLILRYRPLTGEYLDSLPDGVAVLDVYDRILDDTARGLPDGEHIVIVVDGLDEMDPIRLQAGVSRMAALPRRVPAKVFFIVAQRRVDRPIPADLQPVVVDLRSDSTSNVQELHAYIEQTAGQSWLLSQLHAAGRSVASFVAELDARATGSWVYAHYFFEDLRAKRRSVADLQQLPTGLPGYYHDFFDRYRSDGRWHALIKPALAAIAAAREPPTFDQITEWSNTSTHKDELRALLRDSFGPFIRARGEPPQFFPVHITVIEFLSGTLSGMPDTPLRDELMSASMSANRNIINALQQRSDSEGALYAGRHLATHMRRARMTEELSSTLQDRAWYERQRSRKDNPIDIRAYDLDIEEARTLVASDHTMPYTALATWCAFWRATRNSWSAGLEPWAIATLVRAGRLHAQAALIYAQAGMSDRSRARWVVALSRVLMGDWTRELLRLAGDIENYGYRGVALEAIANRPEAPDHIEKLLSAADTPVAARPMISTVLPALDDAQILYVLDRVTAWPAARDSLSPARAKGYIVGELARRTEFDLACRILRSQKSSLDRCFASAAVLAQPWEARIEHRKVQSMYRAIDRAERTIGDWIERREALYEFLRAAGSVDGPFGRQMIAELFRRLRRLDPRMGWFKAIAVAEALPPETVYALASWIKTRLEDLETRWLMTGGWDSNFNDSIPWLAKAFLRANKFDKVLETLCLGREAQKIADATEAVVTSKSVPADDSSKIGTAIACYLDTLHHSAALQVLGATYCRAHTPLTGADLEPFTVVPNIRDTDEAHLAQAHLTIARITHTPPELLEAVVSDALGIIKSNSCLLHKLASKLIAIGRATAAVDVIPHIDSPHSRARALLELLACGTADAGIALDMLEKDQGALKEILEDFEMEGASWGAHTTGLELAIQGLPMSTLWKAIPLLGSPTCRSSPARDKLTAEFVARMAIFGLKTEANQLISGMKSLAALLPQWSGLSESVREEIVRRVEDETDCLDQASLALYKLQRGDPDGIELVFSVAQQHGIRSSEVTNFLSLLPLSDRQRFIRILLQNESAGNSMMMPSFRWLIPHIDEVNIQELLARARNFRDDFRQEEVVVALLPRIAELLGFEAAWSTARRSLRRGDWSAQAYLTLFPWATGDHRTAALKEIVDEIDRGESTDVPFWSSLGGLAESLDSDELEFVISRLLIQMFAGGRVDLEPFAERASQFTHTQAIAIWRRIMPELEMLPRKTLFEAFGDLAPLIGKLEGVQALVEVQRAIGKARDWWP